MRVPTSFHLNLLGVPFEIKGILEKTFLLPLEVIDPKKVIHKIDIDVRTQEIFVKYAFSSDFRDSPIYVLSQKYAVDEKIVENLERELVSADKKNLVSIGKIASDLLLKIAEKPPMERTLQSKPRSSHNILLSRL
jgi:hypothetical protein